MMRALKLSVGAALLCMLAACVVPQNFQERLATGYQDVIEVRNTGATLFTAEKISVQDAENIQKQADVVRAGLDVANDMAEGLDPAAEDKLDSTINILSVLKTYLEARKKGMP